MWNGIKKIKGEKIASYPLSLQLTHREMRIKVGMRGTRVINDAMRAYDNHKLDIILWIGF